MCGCRAVEPGVVTSIHQLQRATSHRDTGMIECKALLFDLDGVLADSTASIELHWRNWAAFHALDADAVLHQVHGRRAVDVIRAVAPHLNAEEEFRRLAAAEAEDTSGVTALPGAVALLARLPATQWAIVTSGTSTIARARLAACGLPEPTVLIPAEILTRGKPDPEGYLSAATRLGFSPPDCVVIEDAPAGVAAAQAAGMRCVALTTTHRASEVAVADWCVASLAALTIEVREDRAGAITFALAHGLRDSVRVL